MKFNFIQKLTLSLFCLTFILYFASDILLNQLAYSVFDIDAQGNFTLLESEEVSFITIKNYALLMPLKYYSYIISFFTGFISVFFLRKKVKERNWLFMMIAMFLMVYIIDFYSNFQQVRLSMAIFLDGVSSFDDGSINAFFVELYQSVFVSVTSGFSLLAKLSIVFLFVFKPISNEEKNLEKISD